MCPRKGCCPLWGATDMTLSRYQLERTDLLVEIEQGRKVEQALFIENTRSMNTLPTC